MSYERKVANQIARKTNSLSSFSYLMQQMRGAHPSTVKNILAKKSPQLLHELIEREQKPRPEKNSDGHDNPVLAAWYFTPCSTNKFVNLQNWSRKKIALLGTPSLLTPLSQQSERVTLFDFDPKIQNFEERNIQNTEIVRCDIRSDDLSKFNKCFDIAVIDPPWYLEDYKFWLNAAFRLIRQDGIVCGSLFPNLTRPAASQERAVIENTLNENGATFSIVPDFFLYSVPSFEVAQLQKLSLPTAPWKRADLFISTPLNVNQHQPFHDESMTIHSGIDPRKWLAISCGKFSVFLIPHSKHASTTELLEPAEDGDGILRSPSLRSAGRQRANVLTSNGRAFVSADADKLALVLQKIAKAGYLEDNPELISSRSHHFLTKLFGMES